MYVAAYNCAMQNQSQKTVAYPAQYIPFSGMLNQLLYKNVSRPFRLA
jgi:hypothetical protein